MKDLMYHKGYYGSVHLDDKDLILHGKVEFIRALVTYEATDARGLKQAFIDSVENYLDMCEKQGIKAETPFKGSLNVRLGQELHRKIAIAAELHHKSINKFIAEALDEAVA